MNDTIISIVTFFKEGVAMIPPEAVALIIVSIIILCYITSWQLKSCRKKEYNLLIENRKLTKAYNTLTSKLEASDKELMKCRDTLDTLISRLGIPEDALKG